LLQNLDNPEIFTPESLSTIRTILQRHSPEPIHTFSPLRSLRRIILVVPSTSSAIAIRTYLDSTPLSSLLPTNTANAHFTSSSPSADYASQKSPTKPIRIYFAAATPIAEVSESDRHLPVPRSDKLFFISPPPSPPVGWEIKDEDPPNREVHAEDLATALDRLNARARSVSLDARETLELAQLQTRFDQQNQKAQDNPLSTDSQMQAAFGAPISPISPVSARNSWGSRSRSGTTGGKGRNRSSSTVVFQPTEAQMNGGGVAGSPRLPAVVVEDMTVSEGPDSYDGEEDVEMADVEEAKQMEVQEVHEELEGRGERKPMLHTMRPPMDDDY